MKNKIYILAFTLALLSLLSVKLVSADASTQTAMLVDLNKTITLNASTLDAFSDKIITNVTWDFADDTYGQGIVINHTYDKYEGVYDVVVNATDNQGKTITTDLPIIVGGSVPFVSPVATYMAIYFTNKPAGVFSLAVGQSSTTSLGTAGFSSIGKFFNITSNLPNGAFGSVIVFSYDDENDDGIVDGTSVNENSLNVYYYSGSWILIPNPVRDPQGNSLTVSINHFTSFALLSPISSTTQTTTQQTTQPASQSLGGGGGGGGGLLPTTTTSIPSAPTTSLPSATTTLPATASPSTETPNSLATLMASNTIYQILIALAVIAFLLTIFRYKKILKIKESKKQKKVKKS